jgi:hypothetical protein
LVALSLLKILVSPTAAAKPKKRGPKGPRVPKSQAAPPGSEPPKKRQYTKKEKVPKKKTEEVDTKEPVTPVAIAPVKEEKVEREEENSFVSESDQSLDSGLPKLSDDPFPDYFLSPSKLALFSPSKFTLTDNISSPQHSSIFLQPNTPNMLLHRSPLIQRDKPRFSTESLGFESPTPKKNRQSFGSDMEGAAYSPASLFPTSSSSVDSVGLPSFSPSLPSPSLLRKRKSPNSTTKWLGTSFSPHVVIADSPLKFATSTPDLKAALEGTPSTSLPTPIQFSTPQTRSMKKSTAKKSILFEEPQPTNLDESTTEVAQSVTDVIVEPKSETSSGRVCVVGLESFVTIPFN